MNFFHLKILNKNYKILLIQRSNRTSLQVKINIKYSILEMLQKKQLKIEVLLSVLKNLNNFPLVERNFVMLVGVGVFLEVANHLRICWLVFLAGVT